MVKVTPARSKVKSRSHHDIAHLHPNQCPYQVSTSYTLRFLSYKPHNIFKLKVTMARSKVKSRSHHDIAHLHPPNQCPYQVSTSYTLWFLRYGPTTRSPAHLDTMGKNNTHTALKGCGVKISEIFFLLKFPLIQYYRYIGH